MQRILKIINSAERQQDNLVESQKNKRWPTFYFAELFQPIT